MAILTQPTGSQILNVLVPSGDGASLGTWSETRIDDYVSAALVNVVEMEFTYASDLLTANGFDPNALSSADWQNATMAMIQGIGYELMKLDFASNTPISGENGGVRVDAYMKSDSRFFNEANRAWKRLGIDSKYTRSYITMSIGTVERNALLPTGIYENNSSL